MNDTDEVCGVVVFDLDDTLYKELDFVKSAYRTIAMVVSGPQRESVYAEMLEDFHNSRPVFERVLRQHDVGLSVSDLISIYRFHFPEITLQFGAQTLLEELQAAGVMLGLVTDGRSKTQRNKIRSLGLDAFLDRVVISEEVGSEKPCLANFNCFPKALGGSTNVYIADNPRKDFWAPNQLGWLTIGVLDDGSNIHKQWKVFGPEYQPKQWVKSLCEVRDVLHAENKDMWGL